MAFFYLTAFTVLLIIPVAGQEITPELSPPPAQAPAASSPTEQPSVVPTPIPSAQPIGVVPSEDDIARYLAGLPVSPDSPLTGLSTDPRWKAHANSMDAAFSTLDQHQLTNIQAWRDQVLTPMGQLSQNLIYFFGGPDFLYADAFFPKCTTYVLVGLEQIEPIPNLLTIPHSALFNTLQSIQASLNSVLNFSFFITKDMRIAFGRSQIKGVLPDIYVFIARSGNRIQEISYVSLDKDGKVADGKGGSTHGAKIAITDLANGAEKTVYYFTADLSDDGLKRNSSILRFTQALAPANSFLKAASYLLHENFFSKVRNFLLQNSILILQDDSGIPVHYLPREQWTLRFFGSYPGPIPLFAKYHQPDLGDFYRVSSPKRLNFGIGYRWNSHDSNLILAVKR